MIKGKPWIRRPAFLCSKPVGRLLLDLTLAIALMWAVTGMHGGYAHASEGTENAKETSADAPEREVVLLERDDWAPDVKAAINDFLTLYGTAEADGAGMPAVTSDNPSEVTDSLAASRENYVVFDFDNTCSVFDVQEQMFVFQIEKMAFAILPEQMGEILLTGIGNPDRDLSPYGMAGCFRDLAADICAAYAVLWERYGPFDCTGLADEAAGAVQADPYWQEFSAKIRTMYNLVYAAEPANTAYPWVIRLCSGMTGDDVYRLTWRSLEVYSGKETSTVSWTSPDGLSSRTGKVTCRWTSGISVTDNIVELWRALDKNGIDVWVCSASDVGAIRAAIDFFGLHDYCRGLLGMTLKTDASGRYINEYDYETGCGFYSVEDGWEKMSRPTGTQTQGEGKALAIVHAIAPEYGGRGPAAGFMDSTGDFQFCTEFASLKIVVCFNRADRRAADGGGLIAAIAIYERDSLGYDFAKALEAGDTLYLLQGRNENGLRSLRSSNATLKLGIYDPVNERLFRDEENTALLNAIRSEGLTVGEALRKYAVRTPANANGPGFAAGFLNEYRGYHSIP